MKTKLPAIFHLFFCTLLLGCSLQKEENASGAVSSVLVPWECIESFVEKKRGFDLNQRLTFMFSRGNFEDVAQWCHEVKQLGCKDVVITTRENKDAGNIVLVASIRDQGVRHFLNITFVFNANGGFERVWTCGTSYYSSD